MYSKKGQIHIWKQYEYPKTDKYDRLQHHLASLSTDIRKEIDCGIHHNKEAYHNTA